MTISEERFAELENRVAKLEGVVFLQNPSSSPAVSSMVQKKFSAREFLLTKKLNSETQKTLALCYYLERVGGMTSFNVDDLVAVFQAAKEPRPKNVNDAVNKNIARGLIMEAPEKKDTKKAWVLTSTGEKYVEEDLTK